MASRQLIQPNLFQSEQNKAFVEELGVHYGNGSLFDNRRWGKTGFDIYGDLYDDHPYLEFYVSKLIEHAYGIKPRSYVHPRSATLILRTLSRNALSVKENVGIQPGRKTHLHLPRFLQASKSEETIAPFLRGLVDIEGSLRLKKQFGIATTIQFWNVKWVIHLSSRLCTQCCRNWECLWLFELERHEQEHLHVGQKRPSICQDGMASTHGSKDLALPMPNTFRSC